MSIKSLGRRTGVRALAGMLHRARKGEPARHKRIRQARTDPPTPEAAKEEV